MDTITQTICICGNSACQVRIRRKLLPFCQMPRPAQIPELGIYSSFAEAAEYQQPGQRVRSITRSGGPKRFVVVGQPS